MKEELRGAPRGDPGQAAEVPEAWIAWATRSRIRPFVKRVRTIRGFREDILAKVSLGLSKGR